MALYHSQTRRPKGGGTLIFSYIRRLGFKILIFNIIIIIIFFFGGGGVGVRKINIFLGMKILWIFFGVITKLDYI